MHHVAPAVLVVLLLLTLSFAMGQPGAQEPPAPPAEGAAPLNLRPILPADIYAVPGIETNVYFDNIVLNPHSDMLLWDVD